MIVSREVRADRIERLHDWFALQLRFADTVAEKSNIPFGTAVTFYTNLHPRLGFGRPTHEGGESLEWKQFVRQLEQLPPGERTSFTKIYAGERLLDWSGDVQHRFGCFGFDGPNEGDIRLHFIPVDREGGVGPLGRARSETRIAELKDMFAFIRNAYEADAKSVVGGSWLYNLDAYRRLFPPAYIACLKVHKSPSQLTGGSWWGQFIDHEEHIVLERVAEFTARLKQLDTTALWKLFPLPPMRTRVAIDAFYEHYGVAL